MKSLFALTLVAFSMACEDCPGDSIAWVIDRQIAVLNESYTFNFAFGAREPLEISEIYLNHVPKFVFILIERFAMYLP